MDKQTCRTCDRSFAVAQGWFYADAKNKDKNGGWSYHCKHCHHERATETKRERDRKYRQRVRWWLRQGMTQKQAEKRALRKRGPAKKGKATVKRKTKRTPTPKQQAARLANLAKGRAKLNEARAAKQVKPVFPPLPQSRKAVAGVLRFSEQLLAAAELQEVAEGLAPGSSARTLIEQEVARRLRHVSEGFTHIDA